MVKQELSLGVQTRVSSRTFEGTEFLTRTTLMEHSKMRPDADVYSKECCPANLREFGEAVPSKQLQLVSD